MKVKAIHFHAPATGNETTPCGRHIRKVQWVSDEADVTCNTCLKALR